MKNIILFLTCDHGAWANGFYGNKHIITPTLDKLANDGIWSIIKSLSPGRYEYKFVIDRGRTSP